VTNEGWSTLFSLIRSSLKTGRKKEKPFFFHEMIPFLSRLKQLLGNDFWIHNLHRNLLNLLSKQNQLWTSSQKGLLSFIISLLVRWRGAFNQKPKQKSLWCCGVISVVGTWFQTVYSMDDNGTSNVNVTDFDRCQYKGSTRFSIETKTTILQRGCRSDKDAR
jgi:hypothetical protein